MCTVSLCLAPVCKRWQRLAILSWRSLKRLSFENMFKSIFRAGKHGKRAGRVWCAGRGGAEGREKEGGWEHNETNKVDT